VISNGTIIKQGHDVSLKVDENGNVQKRINADDAVN